MTSRSRWRPQVSRQLTKRQEGLPVGWAPTILALGALAIVVLPLAALLQRAPWSTLVSQLSAHEAWTALRLSIITSLGALAVSAAFGIPLAWVLARRRFPGRALVRALVTLPMVLPPVVGGIALLYAFGRHGFAGHILYELTGWRLVFTTGGAILAETFVAMPFLIITAEAAFRSMDQRAEEAAATLGASAAYRFRRVTLPAVAPALAAGAALTWARALGEFGATITFAGNFPGRTQTTPLLVFLDIESGHEATALALSLVMLMISLLVLVGLRDRWLGTP
ncbi:MAG: molybdate ABC transporter permease subunit [Acidimicrobiia bacterium]|nr:molybdate ABC transporter permease subunit [Acidimicrobiia bacterium]